LSYKITTSETSRIRVHSKQVISDMLAVNTDSNTDIISNETSAGCPEMLQNNAKHLQGLVEREQQSERNIKNDR